MEGSQSRPVELHFMIGKVEVWSLIEKFPPEDKLDLTSSDTRITAILPSTTTRRKREPASVVFKEDDDSFLKVMLAIIMITQDHTDLRYVTIKGKS